MPVEKLLIANRGEIAIRIARAADELDIATVAIHSEDDGSSLHTRATNESIELNGRGVAAYLDIDQIVQTALVAGCDAVHPGYGFLAENADFAQALEAAGIVFVGPSAEQLALFGDKLAARALAAELDVPLVPATQGAATLEEVEAFLSEHHAIMIKAVAGGGGRGMRAVLQGDDVAAVFERCQSEAQSAFGNGDLYAERLVERARHVEVQIIGDGTSVVHLGERECTLQRQNQKIIEIAPSPSIESTTRDLLTNSSVRMASHANYRGLGTWEFLVDAENPSTVAFIETNARLQVEHTVTEEVTGIDLVRNQILIAGGASLIDLGLSQDELPSARGYAIQCRVNTETMTEEGLAKQLPLSRLPAVPAFEPIHTGIRAIRPIPALILSSQKSSHTPPPTIMGTPSKELDGLFLSSESKVFSPTFLTSWLCWIGLKFNPMKSPQVSSTNTALS